MISSAPIPGQAIVKEIIELPVEYVWPLLKDFTAWGVWSPFYLDMKVPENYSPPQGQKARQFKSLFDDVEDQPNIEVTEAIDDANHILRYRTVKNSKTDIPPIATTIKLKSNPDAKSVEITWESHAEPITAKGGDLFIVRMYNNLFGEKKDKADKDKLGMLVAAQEKIYKGNVYGVTFHLMFNKFKDDAFNTFNKKLLNLGGQYIVANAEPEKQEYKYSVYSGLPKGVSGDDMPKKVVGIPIKESLPPRKLSLMLKRVLEMSYMSVSSFYQGGIPSKFNYEMAAKSLAQLYGTEQDIQLTNDLLGKWDTDEEFCQQLLQGVNPMMIERITEKNYQQKVPAPMRDLSVENNGKLSVEQLAKDGRLFLVDYKDLDGLPVSNKDMYFYAPYLLVYKELLPNNQNRLNIVGIQLDRHGKNPIVYAPKKTPKNLWTLAKMFVASADNQVHEFRYHLGLAHLIQEPTIIAVHNALPVKHIIRRLLQPHLDETIGINFFARQTLIASEQASTDRTFVVGTSNALRLVSTAWKNYDFIKSSFPEQLAARGFDRQRSDGLDNYYYRDDGFKLWDCIGDYTARVVKDNYKNDSDVANDAAIQAWAKEMSSQARANVKGFPSQIASKAQLAHVCQIIIWHGSALHSVVNYPQWPYLGFIKNRPDGLYKPMPEGLNEISEEYIEESLVPVLPSLFQILSSWILSAQANDTTLIHLRAVDEKNNAQFQESLAAMAKKINERNEKLRAQGKTPYIFCLPENVACSINI